MVTWEIELTAHIGEQKRAQDLEAIDCSGEIRSGFNERAIHLHKTLRTGATNGGQSKNSINRRVCAGI